MKLYPAAVHVDTYRGKVMLCCCAHRHVDSYSGSWERPTGPYLTSVPTLLQVVFYSVVLVAGSSVLGLCVINAEGS